MRNLVIIPVRSGSKGLKDKNIKLLNGKPMLAYSIDAAKQSGLFAEIMVSTDSKIYAVIAQQHGAKVPFLRVPHLSDDTASSWDVVKDVVNNYIASDQVFDTVALLQLTLPLRTAQDIIDGYALLESKSANSVVSVCEIDHSPLWSNTLPEDCSLEHFIRPDVAQLPRQKIPTYYRINGALYIIKSEYLFEAETIYSNKSYVLVMSKTRSVDIDDQLDFMIVEKILSSYFSVYIEFNINH